MKYFKQKSKSKSTFTDRANVVQAGSNRLKRLGQIISIITVSAVIAGLTAYLLDLHGEQKYYAYAFGLVLGVGIGISLEREIENLFTYWLELIYSERWNVFRSFNWWSVTVSFIGAITFSIFMSFQGNDEISTAATNYKPTDVSTLSLNILNAFGLGDKKDTTNTASSDILKINNRFDSLIINNNKSIDKLNAKIENGTASSKEMQDFSWLSNGYAASIEKNRLKAIAEAKKAETKKEEVKSDQITTAAAALSSVLKEVNKNDKEREKALLQKEAKYNSWLKYIILIGLLLTISSIIVGVSTEKKTIAKAVPKQRKQRTKDIDKIIEVSENDIKVRAAMNTKHMNEAAENEVLLSTENNQHIPFSVDVKTASKFFDNPNMDYDTYKKKCKAARTAFNRQSFNIMTKHIDTLEAAGYNCEVTPEGINVDKYKKPSLTLT